jgi:hypothetical protein
MFEVGTCQTQATSVTALENQLSGSLRNGFFVDELKNYQLLKNDRASLSYLVS